LLWRRANVWGVAAGISTGFGLVLYFTYGNVALGGLNVGFVALALNVLVTIGVSLLTPPKMNEPVAVASGSGSIDSAWNLGSE